MHQHDLFTQGQTHSCTGFLGGKEWRKDLLLNLWRHTPTIVLNLQLDDIPRLNSRQTNIGLFNFLDRLNCIQQKVYDNLLQ